LERLTVLMREAFSAAIWVGVASLALAAAMSLLIFWYLQ